MPLFRRRPTTIEAMQWDGTGERADDIVQWANAFGGGATIAFRARGSMNAPMSDRTALYIETLEGRMNVSRGDWVIRGTAGELYPCKPEIFADIYEPAE